MARPGFGVGDPPAMKVAESSDGSQLSRSQTRSVVHFRQLLTLSPAHHREHEGHLLVGAIATLHRGTEAPISVALGDVAILDNDVDGATSAVLGQRVVLP